jgi:hypothetical protein
MSNQGNDRRCGNLSNGFRRDQLNHRNSLWSFARKHTSDESLLSRLTFHFPILWSIELISECRKRNWHVSLINLD